MVGGRLVVAALIFGTIVGCLIYGFSRINHGIKDSEGYRQALATARADPRVTAALGEPINDKILLNASMSYGKDRKVNEIHAEVPLHGPKGDATMFVSGSKRDEAWQFTKLSVRIGGKSEDIDLRNGSGSGG